MLVCFFRQFQHENLVKLYGVCTKQGPIFIVQELMVNGEKKMTNKYTVMYSQKVWLVKSNFKSSPLSVYIIIV